MKIFVFIFSLVSVSAILAQSPVIEWQKCFGGGNDDYVTSFQQTSDLGYVMVGSSSSNILVVKTDSLGNLDWQYYLGGSGLDEAFSIFQTSDNGYIIGGRTNSPEYSLDQVLDSWIIKLDSLGQTSWQLCLGDPYTADGINSIIQTSDGGYIFCGFNNYYGCIVTKISSSGIIEWESATTGVSANGNVIKQTNDGGYIVGGDLVPQISYTSAGDPYFIVNFPFINSSEILTADTSSHSLYQPDAWVVKYDPVGNINWYKHFGGSSFDYIKSIRQTSDGGYIVLGITNSNDGDVSGNHGDKDLWVVKLDINGNISWQKCIGGTMSEGEWASQVGYGEIIETSNGKYIIVSMTESNDGDVTGNHSDLDDGLFVELDSNGNIISLKCFGGSGFEAFTSITERSDGGYTLAGYTENSNDGDVTCNNGNLDFWLLKLKTGNTLSLPEHTNSNQKTPFKIYNILGQETEFKPNTVLIYVYSDGTTERVFKTE
jgi:uncharacterized protein YuzE